MRAGGRPKAPLIFVRVVARTIRPAGAKAGAGVHANPCR
jgi:hypothetical protein